MLEIPPPSPAEKDIDINSQDSDSDDEDSGLQLQLFQNGPPQKPQKEDFAVVKFQPGIFLCSKSFV